MLYKISRCFIVGIVAFMILFAHAQVRDDAFEKRIAYMFGATDPTPIQLAYLAAINEMDAASENISVEELQEVMVPHFQTSYYNIGHQLGLIFSEKNAAIWEFRLFMAHRKPASFDEIVNIMNHLYCVVLGGNLEDYQVASEKRTELFQMKTKIEQSGAEFTEKQKKQMMCLQD